jgi:hypothetical protein
MSSRWIVVSLALATMSCTVDIGAPPKNSSVRVISDISRSDTIDAAPASAMVIEISRSGIRLEQPVAVTIAGIPLFDVTQGLEMIPSDPSQNVSGAFTITTDGDASFKVRFGKHAGQAGIVVSVDELQLTDTLWFTVKPGAPAHIRLKPSDTAVVVGGSFTQDGAIIDRGGNELTGRPSFAASDPALTVSATGAVQANAIGRTGVVATYANSTVSIRDVAMVSVVPTGRIAEGISVPGTAVTSAIAIRRTDGSLIKSFPLTLSPFQPAWSPDGLRVYYVASSADPAASSIYRLFALTIADGSVREIVSPSIAALNGAYLDWPAPSHDDVWLYFSANQPGAGVSLWRIHPDGTAPEQVVAPTPPGPGGPYSPSPSPDGTRLAYVLANDVKILTLATGGTTTIHGTGADIVSWAPSGERLATRGAAGLYVVNSDGSGMTQLASNASYYRGLGWSPDGRWIVLQIQTVPTIVDAATGVQLPTPLYGAGFSWSN